MGKFLIYEIFSRCLSNVIILHDVEESTKCCSENATQCYTDVKINYLRVEFLRKDESNSN